MTVIVLGGQSLMRTNVVARTFLVAGAISAFAAAPTAAQGMPQNSATTHSAVLAAPRISVNDTIEIQVLGPAHDRFSGTFTVALDGCIEYPRFGRITVKDMTAEEVRLDITKRLGAELLDPQVIVGLQQAKNKQVFVGGEVRSVAPVMYANSITVRQALIMAGGLTEQAAAEATIVRAGSPNLSIDVVRLFAGDPAVPDMALQEGDTILVDKAKPVFIQGPVGAPGQYIVRPGTTVQQLVTMAGGITEKGKNTGIKIQRPSGDPKKKAPEIEVKDWKTEVVKPGDVVIVPKRVW